MLGDEDSEVRLAAAEALGRFGAYAVQTASDPEAIRGAVVALIRLLKDPQPDIRASVAKTLGAIASAKPASGAGPGPRGGTKPAPAAAIAGKTPIDTGAVIAALIETLNDGEAKVRGAAVAALGAAAWMADPPGALAATLADESPTNRDATVTTLVAFHRGLDSWIPSLLRIAEHDHDRSVREWTVRALYMIEPPAITAGAVPALVAGLQSRDRRVQIATADLLGRLGPDALAAIPALLRVLTEPTDENVAGIDKERENLARSAAFALGKIAPGSPSCEEVVTALTEVARSGHQISQGPAAWALSDFGMKAAAAVPVLIRMVREVKPARGVGNPVPWAGGAAREEAAARTLGLIAPDTPAADEAVTALVTLLECDWPPTRAAAIEALERFGAKAASAIPKVRVLRDDPDFQVKRVAARAVRVLEAASK
jgi:HEAT repeat protein